MISGRIRIEDGPLQDLYKGWGFIYKAGDRRFAPPEKKRTSTSYIEEAGAHEDARTVDDVFDYKVSLLLEAPNKDLVNANSKIKAWNEAVRERVADSDVKRCRTVTLYDDYKRCKIVGIPEIIESVDEKDYYRRQDGSAMDCVVVELTIHVSEPGLCEFDIPSGVETTETFEVELSPATSVSAAYGRWDFAEGFVISNAAGKDYAASGDYMKFSRGVQFEIEAPPGCLIVIGEVSAAMMEGRGLLDIYGCIDIDGVYSLSTVPVTKSFRDSPASNYPAEGAARVPFKFTGDSQGLGRFKLSCTRKVMKDYV